MKISLFSYNKMNAFEIFFSCQVPMSALMSNTRWSCWGGFWKVWTTYIPGESCTETWRWAASTHFTLHNSSEPGVTAAHYQTSYDKNSTQLLLRRKCADPPSSWIQSHKPWAAGWPSAPVSLCGCVWGKQNTCKCPAASSAAQRAAVAALSVSKSPPASRWRADGPCGRAASVGSSDCTVCPAGGRRSLWACGSGAGTGSSRQLRSACWRRRRVPAAGPPLRWRPCGTPRAMASVRLC